ncbi:MAG: sensor histidine kinase, partial [Bacteroidota bacterium]
MKCFRHLAVLIVIFLIALTGNESKSFAETETDNNFRGRRYKSIHLSPDGKENTIPYLKSVSSTYNVDQFVNDSNSYHLKLIPGNFDYLRYGIGGLIIINIILLYFFIKKKKHKRKLEKENQKYHEHLQDWKQKYSKQKIFLNSIPEILFVFNNEKKIADVKTYDHTLLPLPTFKIINNSINEIFPARESKVINEYIQKSLSENSIQSFSFSSVKKYANYEVQLIPMQGDQVLCLFRDVSRENKILERLENSLKNLEETHTARDKFFSIIAHDLKNPFNALIGFSSLLNEEFDSLPDEENKEYIKQIYQSSESLFNLLKDLLAWTKSKTGELDYNPQKLDFNSMLNENLKILWPEAQQKDITIYSNIANDPVFVSADKNMLNSIFRNLTANAIKFTDPGGTISVSTNQDEAFIECAIADNGIGISAENIK